MLIYDFPLAPNPRRLRLFLAEKGISIPFRSVDLAAGGQFDPDFKAINPNCTVPVLLLDDGTAISEVTAIWGYLEEQFPEPRLLGAGPAERAVVTMWERRVEWDGLLAAAEALRNSARGLAHRALVGPHDYEQIPELAERGRARVANFHQDLDRRLQTCPYVAGAAFSVADITAVVAIDFAAARLKMPMPEDAKALRRWHEAMAMRPSYGA